MSAAARWFGEAAGDELTIFERSQAGRRAFVAPPLDVPDRSLDELLPERLRRAEPPRLPEVSEPELVRHYNRLSKRNFDLDTGFYPLGSCTMKHNPKLHERVAALDGHARLHPLQDPCRAQGALELMWRLQEALAEIAGLPYVSLQPSAGSHGELAGVLLTRAYHEDRGERRTKVLTPDNAHGTNPATVTMAGCEVVKVETDARGNVDINSIEIVRSTHENWDGTGYPDGLAGDAIPLSARIIGACDAYSAMTSDRPYRAARTQEDAIGELRRCAGRQFDPSVVDHLCDVLATESEPAADMLTHG